MIAIKPMGTSGSHLLLVRFPQWKNVLKLHGHGLSWSSDTAPRRMKAVYRQARPSYAIIYWFPSGRFSRSGFQSVYYRIAGRNRNALRASSRRGLRGGFALRPTLRCRISPWRQHRRQTAAPARGRNSAQGRWNSCSRRDAPADQFLHAHAWCKGEFRCAACALGKVGGIL